jgi:hypothetical protein
MWPITARAIERQRPGRDLIERRARDSPPAALGTPPDRLGQTGGYRGETSRRAASVQATGGEDLSHRQRFFGLLAGYGGSLEIDGRLGPRAFGKRVLALDDDVAPSSRAFVVVEDAEHNVVFGYDRLEQARVLACRNFSEIGPRSVEGSFNLVRVHFSCSAPTSQPRNAEPGHLTVQG